MVHVNGNMVLPLGQDPQKPPAPPPGPPPPMITSVPSLSPGDLLRPRFLVFDEGDESLSPGPWPWPRVPLQVPPYYPPPWITLPPHTLLMGGQ